MVGSIWCRSDVNLSFFLCLAACRTRPSACDTLSRFCARRVLCWSAFPLAPALRSTDSAADCSALFIGFPATTTGSDFSGSCIAGYDSSSSRRGPTESLRRSNPRPPGSRPKSFRTCQGLRPRRVAIGVDAKGDKHPLGLVEGATENAATVQALIDNLVERGLDPAVPRLFIIDGAKALSKAIRRTFDRAAAIQRCQIHKARNIMERLPKSLHASVRRVLRQAWELDDADRAEKLLRNLAQRLERDWSGVAGSILEGIDEILKVTRLGLPKELRALARLYQHHRECHEHGAARLPQREAMALGLDGDALDHGRHAGSSQRLPTTEGSQAASNVAGRSGSSSQQRLTRPCSPSHRRLTSISTATASQMFNTKRDIPGIEWVVLTNGAV